MIRLLHGCEPNKVSTNVLEINAGSVGSYYGPDVYDLPQARQIDLTRVGLWGMDRGSPGGELYVYVVAGNGAWGMVASRARFQSDVLPPAGFVVVRKLPWGVMYDPAWDGIPSFHLTHWPMPEIRYTDSEYSGLWTALAAGPALDWTDIDLSRWLPDTGREALLNVEVRYGGGSAGSAYIRSYGGQATGLFVGTAQPAAGSFTYQSIRTDSARKIQYRVTGSARLFVYVLGYNMSDPS